MLKNADIFLIFPLYKILVDNNFLCKNDFSALAEAKPDDMDEIQAREFFFKNFELWVSQFDNLKKVFQKAL